MAETHEYIVGLLCSEDSTNAGRYSSIARGQMISSKADRQSTRYKNFPDAIV